LLKRRIYVTTQRSPFHRVGQSPLRDHARLAVAGWRARGQAALDLARARVHCQAGAHGHVLTAWHPDPERDGRELVFCAACRAGASLHLGSGRESFSDALLTWCGAR
jgi:hypothetical protein